MSLDVYLMSKIPTDKRCDHCGSTYTENETILFDANITHNLNTMAARAGIYKYLWRPDEIGVTKANELIDPLTKGLQDMKNRPEFFKQFDSSNGWGVYDDFVPWIENYLNACIQYPDATVEVSR